MAYETADYGYSQSSLFMAANWIESLLTGQLGTAVAVISVAIMGVSMLGGRLAYKDGVRILSGCFILFGAPVIAGSLAGLGRNERLNLSSPPMVAQVTVPQKVTAGSTNPFDPYIGSSSSP